MTAYSRACYFAKQAAALCRYNGLNVAGFSRLPAPRDGAIWQFRHEESGLVILLNASGAVNAKATKAAREDAAAADLARLVASAKEARDMAREVDSALAALDGRKTLDELEEEARAADLAPRAPLPAFCVPLAPIKAAPAPLWPIRPRAAFAELAAVMGAF